MTGLERTGRSDGGVALDHTSFAVHDAMDWARLLRRLLGATPIAGETLPEFRYLLLHVGTAEAGGRLELLEPVGPGFLTRHLDKRGEGPHHVTFTVPDLEAMVDRVRALGATVVGETYDHPPWREAFLAPDHRHGVVVQLAQSDLAYPSAQELLSTRDRDTARFPSTRGATDPLWWTPLWDEAPQLTARLGATHLGSTDLQFSRRLFGDVLGGRVVEGRGFLDISWPGGSLRVHASDRPGVMGASLRGGGADELRIGAAWLGART
ncbi:VOC family protein [Blastococcus deserti]|uniref:VOC family protein n=1 Tax=Blastococcus deserti TaxID=2259033 RepID=A0ABW4XEB9_9ACTN